MSKSSAGRFFEDFGPGEEIAHPTARTITAGDQALYTALTGSRFALHQSDVVARGIGHPSAPLDDLLVFHLAFGRTVADVSLNAVANLGYAECRFLNPVFVGDSISAASTVIGLKENSNGRTGTVHVRTRAQNQRGEMVVEFVRWVMVNKRGGTTVPALAPPALGDAVAPVAMTPPPAVLTADGAELACGGSRHRFDDFAVGERIDHVDGVTVEEAEHMLATRLYQNSARVHFNAQAEAAGRFGRRIVYGGHVMSLARALSFNGLASAFRLAAINGGRHVAPVFGGSTIHAWSEVRAKADAAGRTDVGLLRLSTFATKDLSSEGCPNEPATADRPGIVLELDYWAFVPR